MTEVLNNPLVSICIPAYNAALYIKEALQGWRKQSYNHIEIIVQDDCSKDDTYKIALELAKSDSRIQVFRNDVNLGIGANWNEAYKKVSGAYVVIFNADDLIQKNFILDSLKIFNENLGIDMVIHNFRKSFEIGNEKIILNQQSLEGLTHDLINHKNIRRIHWNFTLIKQKKLNSLQNKYGLFYPTQVCDTMLFFEAFKKNYLAYYTSKIGGVYRLHDQNSSKIKFGEFESTFIWMIPTYPKIFELIHPKSFIKDFQTILGYIYNCLKEKHKPEIKVIKTIFKFRIL